MKTCGYSLEAPWQGASNEYHMFLWKNNKTYQYFFAEKSASSVAMLTYSTLS